MALHENATAVSGTSSIADLVNRNFAANPAQLKDHRLIVMFFDLSSMQPEDTDRAVEAAQDYINKKMQPADLAAVVSMDTGLSLDQDFQRRQGCSVEGCRKVQRYRRNRLRQRKRGGTSGGTSDDAIKLYCG